MRRKSKKVQADYNAIIEAKMINKAQELVDKARAKHLGMSLVMGDFPVPLDLDATKLVREVVASVKRETLSFDCGSIKDEVETVRTFDDPDEKDAKIIKLEADRDALLDKLHKKTRTSDTTLIKIDILGLCETVCDDRYPHKVRQGDFLKSKELLDVLDNNLPLKVQNCDGKHSEIRIPIHDVTAEKWAMELTDKVNKKKGLKPNEVNQGLEHLSHSLSEKRFVVIKTQPSSGPKSYNAFLIWKDKKYFVDTQSYSESNRSRRHKLGPFFYFRFDRLCLNVITSNIKLIIISTDQYHFTILM